MVCSFLHEGGRVQGWQFFHKWAHLTWAAKRNFTFILLYYKFNQEGTCKESRKQERNGMYLQALRREQMNLDTGAFPGRKTKRNE